MQANVGDSGFAPLASGFNTTFLTLRLGLGLVVPLETYATGPVPRMERRLERAWLIDDPDVPPQPPDLGFRLRMNPLQGPLR